MNSLSDQIKAYDAIKDSLETDYFGKWVVIHGQQLVGHYDSFEDAANDAIKKYGKGPYLIRKVGVSQVFHPPASLLYKPYWGAAGDR